MSAVLAAKFKDCTICPHSYPTTKGYWYKDKYSPDMLDHYCKRCRNLKEKYKSQWKATPEDRRVPFDETPEGLRKFLLSKGETLAPFVIPTQDGSLVDDLETLPDTWDESILIREAIREAVASIGFKFAPICVTPSARQFDSWDISGVCKPK